MMVSDILVSYLCHTCVSYDALVILCVAECQSYVRKLSRTDATIFSTLRKNLCDSKICWDTLRQIGMVFGLEIGHTCVNLCQGASTCDSHCHTLSHTDATKWNGGFSKVMIITDNG